MHWRRKLQPIPVFLPGESQGWGSLVGCRLWGRTESVTNLAAAGAQKQELMHGFPESEDEIQRTAEHPSVGVVTQQG